MDAEVSTPADWRPADSAPHHLLLKGKPAPKNPWGGRTLEWTTDSPPIEHNFESQPIITKMPYEK